MLERVRRAFSSFLTVPSVIILGFVLLAFGSYALEQADPASLQPLRGFMREHVFGDAAATSALLGTIATGVITITSITFSLLLLALQQSAGALTHQVFDQFLRRRLNQVYFGAFVGITLFALITLATVSPPFNPVLGASIALILTLVALYVLLLLIYAAINQMRPTEIIKTIHDQTLKARDEQLDLLARTRREARLVDPAAATVRAQRDGFIVNIDLGVIAGALDGVDGEVEVVILHSLGAYVAWHDPIAEVRAGAGVDRGEIADQVGAAFDQGRERDPVNDPAYGLDQLETIAWRSISTSQQNPAPGLTAIRNVRDLLARWVERDDEAPDGDRLPVVYPDNVMQTLFGTLESLSVVASESMQHQTLAEIYRTLAVTFPRMPEPARQATVNLVLRSLAGMGDQMLTTQLDAAVLDLVDALRRGGRATAASQVRAARDALAESIGHLNSRSTRVPQAG
jgi:uncharacterized membrane protein